jgi:hypothetical protein
MGAKGRTGSHRCLVAEMYCTVDSIFGGDFSAYGRLFPTWVHISHDKPSNDLLSGLLGARDGQRKNEERHHCGHLRSPSKSTIFT